VDIQQYISSGIIETYVLGMATGDEARELELLCEQYPEIKAALASCEADMEQYATLNAIEPPAEMKDLIWAVIQQEDTKTNELLSAVEATVQAPVTTPNTVAFEPKAEMKRSSPFRTLMAAAAVIALIASVALNAYLMNKSKQTEQEMVAMKSEQQKMLAANKSYQEALDHSNNMLLNPAMKSMVLAGVGSHTGANAMLLWDTKSKEVYLSLKDMPPPPAGKQYQLWAIVDGKPVDAGMYALNSKDAMQKMKVIPNAQMFAITIEKEGGSPTPTLDQMVVAGKV